MRLGGVEVTPADLRTLVDLLLRVGRATDVTVAGRIERGVQNETRILALSPEEGDAILGVLDDPPDGLAELRGELARQRRHRT